VDALQPDPANRHAGREIFHVVLLKPTHYDDLGYPIQFQKSPMPSNSLACLYGLARDAGRRNILGEDVEIRVSAADEANQRVVPATIIRAIAESGGRALIGIVGVQSNQFPRAVDLARPFRAAGLPVCIGGFHVSGILAMFPEVTAEIRAAQDLGISLFAGEAEANRLDLVIRDAAAGNLAAVYNYITDLPPLEDQPTPFLPAQHVERVVGGRSSFDLGRGCPFQCSFCTIINVQGRKSRYRSPDDVEQILRENHANGVTRIFITDDNLARNKHWEVLLDRIIALRAEGLEFSFTIQIDTQCHRMPGFFEKCARAGVRYAFIGLENINPDNLIGAKKRQNKITEYRDFLQKIRKYDIVTMAGYILGFPGDTKESILRDIEIIKRELPLDILEFFFLTPLPGCEDHKHAVERGEWMDPDLNKYDLQHRVTHHPRMSDAEWDEAFDLAWATYYTEDHMRTVLKRAAARSTSQFDALAGTLLFFSLTHAVEGLHPVETGQGRTTYREDRRPGLPIEEREEFRRRTGTLAEHKRQAYARASARMQAIMREVLSASDRHSCIDVATTPQSEEEFAALELYHATHGGEAALARKLRDDAIRARMAVADRVDHH
jgi:hypothetical protein